MKLAKTDKKILEKLVLHPQGLTVNQISVKVGVNRFHTYKRLKKLVDHNILIKFNKYPTFYQLGKSPSRAKEFAFIKLICPKCSTIQRSIHFRQERKVCDNEHCLTKAGKRTRFCVSENRTVESEFLF